MSTSAYTRPSQTEDLTAKLSKAYETVAPYALTALHIGFIPLIIGVALVTTEPRPTLLQLLSPM